MGFFDRGQALEHAFRGQDGDAFCALTQFGFQNELAVMLGEDGLNDGQAKACSLLGALDRD